jgi:uncharacterized membrane protein
MTHEKNPLSAAGQFREEQHVRDAEWAISTILRTGVFVSVAVIAIGAVISLFRHPAFITSAKELHDLKGAPDLFPHSFGEIVRGVRILHGQALASLGLLLLILTPAARVGASILIFLAHHDRLYTLITTVVFMLLLLSFIVGQG